MEEKKLTSQAIAEAIKRWRSSPQLFVEEALGITSLTTQQKQLFRTIPISNSIAVKSGHGVGKTMTEACLILWYLTCYTDSRVIVTAPTEDQITKMLWPEVSKWLMQSKLQYFIEWSKSKIFIKGEEETAYAVYRTATKPEALQGFHATNILFLLEEASGIDDAIWMPVEGALTTSGARVIALGNPTRPEGNFYRAFTDQSNLWTTMTFNCEDSELVSKDYIERMAKKYGTDSDVYRVRVLGEFPSKVSDAFIPLYLCERSLSYEVTRTPRFCMGVDVARFGDDYTVLLIRSEGHIEEVLKLSNIDTMQTVGQVMQMKRKYNIANEDINVDVVGIGAGVVDRLTELQVNVNAVNTGELPNDEMLYLNKRVELWGIVRDELEQKRLNLTVHSDNELSKDLCGELASPKFKYTSKGQWQLESKDDMKRRGVQSPNLADALCLTYYHNNYGFDTIQSRGGIRYEEKH